MFRFHPYVATEQRKNGITRINMPASLKLRIDAPIRERRIVTGVDQIRRQTVFTQAGVVDPGV